MKYEELTIAACVDLVNETLFLPDIQRPYVWEESDIYLLYDSICRNYPINTVLFWYLKKETLQNNQYLKRFKFITERNQENQIDYSPLARDTYYLAIDGQQRITSFYLTLEGNYKIKQKRTWVDADLFYNYESGITENEDGILYEFKFFPQTNNNIFIEEIEDKDDKSIIIKKWIRIKFIYALQERKEILQSIKEHVRLSIGEEISNNANDQILEIWFKLKNDPLISFYKEGTQVYDQVLDIFIRANSGGEKLSYSDLLFSYIKLHWNEARDKFSDLLKLINEGGKFKFSHDFILKTILFIHANDQEHLKYRTNNFKPAIIDDTKLNWQSKLEPAIKLTKDLLVNRFQLTHDKLITSYNALIPIIYFNYRNNKKGIGEESDKLTIELQRTIREWLITSMLTGVFGGQSDGILNKAKKALVSSATSDYFPMKELFKNFNDSKPALNLKISEKIVSDAQYNSIDSHLLLSLLYKNSVNLAPMLQDNKPEQDHIISKSELNDSKISKEKINSIFNIRWAIQSDNRNKSDELYIDWKNRLPDAPKRHFIPEGDWTANNFDEFLQARKVIFLKELAVEIPIEKKETENIT